MDRSRVWPDFHADRILHEDRDLIVVDKPAFVPTQAADPSLPDDLVTRLHRHLARRDGAPAYLGVHQRLDRDTSGVLLFTRRREANAAVAAEFEGRRVVKKYLACVEHFRGDPRGRTTLRDHLAPGKDGAMQVVEARVRGAELAVTHVTVVRKKGGRALLELSLETGRTHQARVQLAHAGAPIAGDRLYGGAVAPRLLLHARSVELSHPAEKRRLEVRAEAPPDFDSWIERGDPGEAIYDDEEALARAIGRAVERRWGLGRSPDLALEGEPRSRKTTAFRLVNEEGDALPGLAVDVYGDHLVAQLYEGTPAPLADPARRERVLDRLSLLGFDGVYLKIRPKQANTLVDTRREDLAPKLPVRGAAASADVVVYEEGTPYSVRLGDGLSTGIFLDQRKNRLLVRELGAGGSVVNLFAYTCAFSVVAALGGAWRTISVDASMVALERGRENMRLAGVLDAAEHAFVAEDVFAWIARTGKRPERHDLVILDPPSYSTTKKRRFVSETDYGELAALALGLLRPGGKLLACSNHRGISRSKLRRFLAEAGRRDGRAVAQIKDLPDPPDFPAPFGREPHLKSALVTLAR